MPWSSRPRSAAQPGQAKVGDAIYLGDIVATGADGKVAITFADDTAFDLSSNARMVMTEFVYDPNSKANSTLLSLTKGTFTFVAGKIAKSGDMKVDTPVATMGIRGTTPHVEISEDGTVRFSTLLEDGKDQVLQKYGAGAGKSAGIAGRSTKSRSPVSTFVEGADPGFVARSCIWCERCQHSPTG